jgi:glucokinase
LNKKTIGIDLSGTSVRVGLFNEDLALLGSESMVTRVLDGPLAVLDDMASAIDRLAAQAGTTCLASASEARIGIGSPGPIDLRTGTLGHLPNFPGWDYFPLRESLA